MAGELIVRIIGDESSYLRTLERSKAASKGFATNTSAVFAGTTAGLTKSSSLLERFKLESVIAGAAGGAAFGAATIGVTAFLGALKTGVDQAGQLQKAGEAIDTTFGRAGAGLKSFAARAADFGISQTESEQFSARIGILTRNLGIGQEKSAEMAQGLQELAGSIAEIRGIDPATVLEKLPLVLAGNLRALKALGFSFTATEIKQEAVTLGLIRQRGALTSTAKAQAVYALVTQNLSQFQQEAAAHSGDLVNQQHRLAAETANLETSLGKLVTGPLTALVTVLAEVADNAVKAVDALHELGGIKIPFTDRKLSDSLLPPGAKDFLGNSAKKALLLGPAVIHNLFNSTKSSADGMKDLVNETALLTGLKIQYARSLEKLAATPAGLNLSASQKNLFFDNAIAREIDRTQDLGIPAEIAALQRISKEIERRISATKDVTRKLTLEDKVVSIARTIKSLLAQQASDLQQAADEAKQKKLDAAQAFLDALAFGVTKAQATKGTNDDLATLRALQDGIKKEISVQGATLDLQRQLFDTQQQIADVIKQRQDAARAALQGRQFRGLGLSATGDTITPGVNRLKLKLAQVEKAVAGTKFDTKKNKGLFDQIFGELNDPKKWGALTKDTRQKIQDLLDGIKSQLGDKTGALTKTTSLADRVGQAFAGLGLDRATEKRLASRLVGFNSAGVALAPSGGPAHGTIILRHETKLDGRVLERSNTKYSQRRQRSNPPQRRGQQ